MLEAFAADIGADIPRACGPRIDLLEHNIGLDSVSSAQQHSFATIEIIGATAEGDRRRQSDAETLEVARCHQRDDRELSVWAGIMCPYGPIR